MTAPRLAEAARSAPGTVPRRLELTGLYKSYGRVVALDDVSFTVEPGRICGFVGSNGAGKTTAMRIALGVVQPDRGEVRWGGRAVEAEQRRRFGYLPEERGLYPKMRVGEQLTYLARLHGQARTTAAEAARYWVGRLGVADRAADRLERLSLGNQQRVQLAAALVHDPNVLLLDEPFSGLDPVGVDALSEMLAEWARAGVGVLFSSHQLDLVERLCDDVVIISDGRLVASGSVEQVRTGGQRLLRVSVPDGGSTWMDGLAGVRPVHHDGAGTLLSLADGVDPQAVLDAARAAGAVHHFGFERLSLAEIFREAVGR